jgi:cytochrome P450
MSKSVTDFNFFDPEVLECPFDFYRLLREEAPIYQLPDTNIHLVTRYDDVRVMLKDTATFSSDFAHMLSGPEESPEVKAIYADAIEPANTLLTQDPPRHKVYRTLVNKVFSAKRVNKMHDYIEQIVDDLIDQMMAKQQSGGGCELIADFASPLPLLVIADQLGIDRELLPKFKQWSDALAARLGGMSSADEQINIAHSIMEFQHYIMGVVNARRQQPKDDMISDLSNTEIDEGRKLNDAEVMSIIQQFLVAGNETTTSTIAGGMLSLIQQPEQMQALVDDPSQIPNAAEEMLRTETPSAGLWRVVTQDTEFNGYKLAKDSLVMLRYASANRDEKIFDEPEKFDVCRRNASDHIAFGQGTHFCPGAMLGRKELILTFEKLLSRLTNIQLADGKNDLTHWPNMVLRGLKELHITFDAK